MTPWTRTPKPMSRWGENAKCLGADKNLFFPELEVGDNRGARAAIAKTIDTYCLKCPVRIECAKYALENREQFGVWAGVWLDGQADARDETVNARDETVKCGSGALKRLVARVEKESA